MKNTTKKLTSKTPKASALNQLGALLTKKQEPAAAPKPAPVATPTPTPAPAPTVAAAPVMGQIDSASKRVTKGAALSTYRVVANQRKGVEAKYYVQGGSSAPHPFNPQRSMFTVAVEIPFADLRAAQARCVELNAAMAKGAKVA